MSATYQRPSRTLYIWTLSSCNTLLGRHCVVGLRHKDTEKEPLAHDHKEKRTEIQTIYLMPKSIPFQPQVCSSSQ